MPLQCVGLYSEKNIIISTKRVEVVSAAHIEEVQQISNSAKVG